MRHSAFTVLLVCGALLISACSFGESGKGADVTPPVTDTEKVALALDELEGEHGVSIGVSATNGSTSIEHRGEERFGYASTIKVFLGAAFLSSVPISERQQTVTWTQADLDAAGHAPMTTDRLATGATFAELAEAAVRLSDNAATNLLLEHIGGPAAVQELLRDCGDHETNMTNFEPELNRVVPDSDANTTTPTAYTGALRCVLEERTLQAEDLSLLSEWMSGNATGDSLIRAALPQGWEVLEKSGGSDAARNDIGVVIRLDGEPIYLTVLVRSEGGDGMPSDDIVAEAARLVLSAF